MGNGKSRNTIDAYQFCMKKKNKKKAKMIFNKYDTNQNGKLDEREFAMFLSEARHGDSQEEPTDTDWALTEYVFDVADENLDGELTFKEFWQSVNVIQTTALSKSGSWDTQEKEKILSQFPGDFAKLLQDPSNVQEIQRLFER
eukprot:TRINITY_DN4654_c0_g1_i2.p1 TRINITY_DN4654_c0_g1~~TRINITY_DN4654_c0_g1_i2.p1  ORF type:complete len:143 (-),score=42.99 TRINITY_DN4654_c0_g1_i2:386-814(-)